MQRTNDLNPIAVLLSLPEIARRVGWVFAAFPVCWMALPFAVRAVMRPYNMICIESWMMGQPAPAYYTSQQATLALFLSLVVMGVIALVVYHALLLTYRRLGAWINLALPAGLTTGLFGNCFWWIFLDRFDATGMLVGCLPFVLTMFIQMRLQKAGADFVLGKGNRPRPSFG
jgi:hypothetical protein